MMIMLKITARLLLLSFLSIQRTLGNTVTVSLSTQTAKTGDPLELTCLLNPSPGADISIYKWFLGSDTTGIHLSGATCNPIGTAAFYDLTHYSFTCSSSSNTFKMKIKALQWSDNGQCWSCSVAFTSFPETDKAPLVCIKLQDNSLLLLLLPVPIICCIICCICCGCLDCCKCSRKFGFYDKSKCWYVTWSCSKRQCCSFFCCRAENKRGTCACGCTSGKEFCGGCHFFQRICTCGWPDCCTSDKIRSCGCCYFICCKKEEDLPFLHTSKKCNTEHTNKKLTSSLGGEYKIKIRPQPLPPTDNYRN